MVVVTVCGMSETLWWLWSPFVTCLRHLLVVVTVCDMSDTVGGCGHRL